MSYYLRCYYRVEGFGVFVATSMGTRLRDDLGPVPAELVRLRDQGCGLILSNEIRLGVVVQYR